MAPQSKRANSTKAPSPSKAKKLKVHDSAEATNPLALQLAPILAALASSKQPSAACCCDILEAALPHCLGEPSEERHSFQIKMLDLTASALKGLEDAARVELTEAETSAESLRNEALVTRSDFEAAQKVADTKKEESDAQGVEVEKFDANVNAAKLEVQDSAEKKDTVLASKANLIGEQEAFQTLLNDIWEPLKACQFSGQQWRKRDRFCSDLIEKLSPLGIEESLIEALQVALKMKIDQRSEFAQKALASAEDAFEKHKVLLGDRIAETSNQESECEKIVAEAEAKLAEMQSQHANEDTKSNEFQTLWAELETKATELKDAASAADAEVLAAQERVETLKAKLETTIQLFQSFVTLRDPPVPSPQQPAEEVSEASMPSPAMQIEPEVVAAA